MLPKKISLGLIFEVVFFLIAIFFLIKPVINYDFWFHLKDGWFIASTGTLPFVDHFSYTALGQPAIPYEWLFDLAVYLIYHHVGEIGIQVLVVATILGYLLIFRQILKEFFSVPPLLRTIFVGSLFLIGYDYWTERPQIIAFLCFMAIFYLVLKRVLANRNWLYVTPLIFLIWVNLHASMILGQYLLLSFGIVSLCLSFLFPSQKHLRQGGKDLLIFGIIASAITILPPLGTKVYQLLYIFFQKREFITRVITEWVPLTELQERFYIYLGIIFICLSFFSHAGYRLLKESRLQDLSTWLIFLPLVPLGLFVIPGVRQTPFAFPALFILLAVGVGKIQVKIPYFIQILTVTIFLGTISILTYFYRDGALKIFLPYPKQAIPFIRENLRGNMFNEYEFGGYLMYELGPERKVFIDGRTDMYLPTVLPEYDYFTSTIKEQEISDIFNKLATKYDISWAILTNHKFTFAAVLGRILQDDNNWQLIYFDDQVFIFAKEGSLNKKTLERFAFKGATPLRKQIYVTKERGIARIEYERMFALSPSALSANALGYFELEDKNYEAASRFFSKALELKKNAAAPKMNLGELAARDGDFEKAISLYREAIEDDPQRGFAYLRLGELIIRSGGSKEAAKKIWLEGKEATPDKDIINKIDEALSR